MFTRTTVRGCVISHIYDDLLDPDYSNSPSHLAKLLRNFVYFPSLLSLFSWPCGAPLTLHLSHKAIRVETLLGLLLSPFISHP